MSFSRFTSARAPSRRTDDPGDTGLRRLALFTRADRGNVAIFFALSLLPMIGMVGIGIDTARTLAVRTSLQAAADAGALAAATEAESIIQNGGSASTATDAGTLAGQRVFGANATKISRWLATTPTPTVNVNPGSANITAFVSFSTPVPTVFGRMFGTTTFTTAGSAASSLALPKYLNISVVTDISQSMGLAATTTGQSNLLAITGCQFGCHVYQSGQSGSLPYEAQAHAANPPIQLRIDVIRSATQNMIQTAQQLATSTPYISFALYTLQGGNNTTDSYGKTADGQPLTTLASASTDYNKLYGIAGTLDLGDNNSSGIGDTDYANAMTALTAKVSTSGSGSSSSPQQFVFLMTDGVSDVYRKSGAACPSGAQSNNSHCTQAFDPATCTALKTKGVTVGVIYTTYLAMSGVDSYDTLVKPFAASLLPNLTSCASPGWFYQASDANDIQVAINALFAKATGHGVLTQ